MQDLISGLLLSCPAALLALLPVGLIVFALRALRSGDCQDVLDKARRMKNERP